MTLDPNLWTYKYRPKNPNELVGNANAVTHLQKWVGQWITKPSPAKKAALLAGPPGTGKTSLVHAIAKSRGYQLVELNASDKRNKSQIDRLIGTTAQQATLRLTDYADSGQKPVKLILLDEVDGLSGNEDRGGMAALIQVIKKTYFPIILTVVDAWDPKLRSVRRYCEVIQFHRLQAVSIVKRLNQILQAEGVQTTADALGIIAENAGGDLRAAINDLQKAALGKRNLKPEDVRHLIFPRDVTVDVYKTLDQIFKNKDIGNSVAAVRDSTVDYNFLIRWISENIPHQITNHVSRAEAYEQLARADLHLARAQRTRNWRLLTYAFELMSAGVSTIQIIQSQSYIRYQFPTWVMKLGRLKSRRTLRDQAAAHIASKTHTSVKIAAQEYIPTLREIFRNNKEQAQELIKWFELESEHIEFIAGDQVAKALITKPKRKKKG